MRKKKMKKCNKNKKNKEKYRVEIHNYRELLQLENRDIIYKRTKLFPLFCRYIGIRHCMLKERYFGFES